MPASDFAVRSELRCEECGACGAWMENCAGGGYSACPRGCGKLKARLGVGELAEIERLKLGVEFVEFVRVRSGYAIKVSSGLGEEGEARVKPTHRLKRRFGLARAMKVWREDCEGGVLAREGLVLGRCEALGGSGGGGYGVFQGIPIGTKPVKPVKPVKSARKTARAT